MRERRYFNSHLEIRESQGDEGAMVSTLSGYAARWNVTSHNLGGFVERLQQGCFSRSLADPANDVKCLRDHLPQLILGRRQNGTLSVSEDSFGLKFSCRLNMNTTIAKDAFELIRTGTVSECSFAFSVDPNGGESWSEEDIDGEPTRVRTLRSASLYDVSVVSNPAYPKTVASVSSAPFLNSLDRSASDLFPDGVPLEVRSRVGDVRMNLERAAARRKALINLVL